MGKRRLLFTNFDQLFAEVDALESQGYTALGKWSLAQSCEHLRMFMECSMHGFDFVPLTWWRRGVGKLALYGMLWTNWMSAGYAAPERFVPAVAAGEEAAVLAAFRRTVGELEEFAGPFHGSPLFGGMTAAQWRRVHLIHAAHHLGFLIPKDAGAGTAESAQRRGAATKPRRHDDTTTRRG